MPSSVASEVIRMGRRRTLQLPRSQCGRAGALVQRSRELTMRMLFDTTMPAIIIRHQRHDVQCASGEQQNEDNTGKSWRNGHQNDERVDERFELRHQDQIDQQDGDDQPHAKFVESLVHLARVPHISMMVFLSWLVCQRMWLICPPTVCRPRFWWPQKCQSHGGFDNGQPRWAY